MAWQERSLCAGVPGFHDPSPDGVEAALALCNGQPCPARQSCHDWAATENGPNWGYEGVAGGSYWVNGHTATPPKSVRFRAPLGFDANLTAAHAEFSRTPKDQRTPALVELEAQYQAARWQIRKMRKAAA